MTETLDKLDDLDGGLAAERFVFDDADWRFYELVLRKVGHRRVFVTFDGERLEVMSPSFRHDVSAERIGTLVRHVLNHLRRPFVAAGSFTLKGRKSNRGLEPDRCFYIRSVGSVEGKREVDLNRDPPPDLAIEVEVSRRLLDRIDIYRRLAVPEVWCYDGRRLKVLTLEDRERYVDAPRSAALPELLPDTVHRLVQQSWGMNDMAWTDLVQQWIGENLPPREP
jgi:Uma2 family endonuclease